ncbi:ATP-dependent 6-phosphofructokinase [Pseudodesulfovibrio senegalensis]|uniref:ATP-dependent 6-phosphofructokinase n=1 Tax=Pseudodesulfovibrio senegalensis TaxID=1721087 RepID=A0A6N6MZN2_9BACT|nr:ATP-dependent 6-phosphofructokinase [Pseudodesulfovibrio senegalensis]KAB1440851.1 ATP-dependent 6-phosphofructokinase [Pseudodesulfovibrio senegalensis]
MKSKTAPHVMPIDTSIKTLGTAKIPTCIPLCLSVNESRPMGVTLTPDEISDLKEDYITLELEAAGPREKLYFDPSKTKCAIVTCGGLCPGINDVIRSVVMEAFHNYNVASIVGVQFGLRGFIPEYHHDFVDLNPSTVADIHQFGGTMLGSSRGHQPAEDIVDALERSNINVLFMIGGDGTMKAAKGVVAEIERRNQKIAVIGIPKTIDNDINLVTKSFGFDTAVEKATEAIRCAHVESVGMQNGVGLVKLMGRESGFIAAQATLALKEVNFVLVPEYPFTLRGATGLLPALERRLAERGHAVIVCAEGAGQELCDTQGKTDASGNPVLGDICSVIKDEMKAYFSEKGMEYGLKYIDPSYIIRSVPANSNDRIYCGFLGQNAVHAAMAGKTGMVISMLQNRMVHLPLEIVTAKRQKLNVNSAYWRSVLESTGQEDFCRSCEI